ncbi:MAG TPA: metalloregulator ArsR/SmtB family transcription factor [Spirochaetota bacterium]|nr:metalloregulator ArsR/SmtB family transcription factor [Spirochaetota bacterium]
MITQVKVSTIFKMLSDTNRLRIINLLMQKELCVCHMAELLGITQTNVSHHLAKLHAAGVVHYRKDGQWIYYSLSEDFVKDNHQLFEYLTQVFSLESIYKDDIKTLHTMGDSHCRA